MLGGISRTHPGTVVINSTATNNTRQFECHPGGEVHGKVLLCVASAGLIANASLAGLIMARKTLRKWSSGLILHGTVVDGARSALLVPLGLSVLNCEPVARCSFLDTFFLLLATISSLNLLTFSLSEGPLLPSSMVAGSLLESAGYPRTQQNNLFTSPLYPKAQHASYYSDYYQGEQDLNNLTDAMPDSPQCVLFGVFIVWFASLVINLGPTFLSGALAAHSEVVPKQPSCPLVRGPERHFILNCLWACVNLLCVSLCGHHLRKLKKDLANARISLLASATQLLGMAGIPSMNPSGSGFSERSTQQTTTASLLTTDSRSAPTRVNPIELENFLRQTQRHGRKHIRTLSALAGINIICWTPLYIVSLISPTGAWREDESFLNESPYIYELVLLLAFAHSIFHPILLVFLHQPLRDGLKLCLVDWCCCCCLALGFRFIPPQASSPTQQSQHRVLDPEAHRTTSATRSRESLHIVRALSGERLERISMTDHPYASNDRLKRSSSIKSDGPTLIPHQPSPSPELHDDGLIPPPPLPPVHSAFRKQLSGEEDHIDRW